MTIAGNSPPERLARVSELTTRLAENALTEMMLHHPVPDRTVRALADAMLLLEEYGQQIPPLALDLLMRIQKERHGGPASAGSDRPEYAPDPDATHTENEITATRKLMGVF